MSVKTELEAAVMAAIDINSLEIKGEDFMQVSDDSIGHLLKKEGRATLAGMAGAALSKRIRNDKLAAVAGGTLARVIAGERVSGKDVLRTSLAMWLTRKGTF